MNLLSEDGIYYKVDLKEIFNIIIRILLRMIETQELSFRSFYLDKRNNINSIDNYRIILISPIELKIIEQKFYFMINDFLEEKIKKFSNKNHYGFLRQNNCDMSINKLKKVK